jgi:hypothetical protein
MRKTDTRLVRHLTAPEIQALLDAPKPVDWLGIRDRAMLHLYRTRRPGHEFDDIGDSRGRAVRNGSPGCPRSDDHDLVHT